MEAKLITELRKDLSLLNKWIANTEYGGWSTQNLDDMKKRRDEIKAVLFDIGEIKPQYQKSCIDWNTSNVKPAVNMADKFDAEQKVSQKVVVIVTDKDGMFCGYSFARYYHQSNHWVIEGYLGTFTVTHWSSLNEPSTACFQPVDNSNTK